MKLLIVEGNNEETRVKREGYGIKPYHLTFREMLRFLVPKARTDVAFPTDKGKNLPSISQLKEYDGVLWTGSSLSVLEDIPDVNRQLTFAETIFESGVPFYGSCWGMQVATVVSGGKVALSGNGLEFGISKPIELTELGKASPFFTNRNSGYSALCIHFDEIAKLPENAQVLASNPHSKVQAMTFRYKNAQFFGVQYHPEFKTSDMALITSFLSERLVKSGTFNSETEVLQFSDRLTQKKNIPKEITDYKLHTQEIMAWLGYIAVNDGYN
jgi:GMP synthase (glutamine-hydrolysing)